jgi:DegV family protein with EDD domain
MTLRIVTDTTCDLPESVVEKFGITVIPLYINVGEQSFLDGKDLSRDEFYSRLPTLDPYPKTAAPGPDTFRQVYEQLAREGATAILSMHVASSLSGTFNSARLGAEQVTSIPVTVFDSQQLSLGLGLQVLAAANEAAKGCTVSEIVSMLEDMVPRVHVFAVLDTLEYLRRSGRVNLAQAGMGTLLRIKPIIKLYCGELSTERVRTSKRAMQRLVDLMESVAPLEQVAMLHSQSPEKAEELRIQAGALIPNKDVMVASITPIIGVHVGPGAVGVACIAAKR